MIKSKSIIAISLILTSSQFYSTATASDKKPLALRKIMHDMGENMQSITDGISREDWQLVEQTAAQVADHPQPPFGEKLRILSYVGTDARRFKKFDGITHDAANKLADVATQKDGQAVIQAFAKLQDSCLQCHQTFRKPFLENFYSE